PIAPIRSAAQATQPAASGAATGPTTARFPNVQAGSSVRPCGTPSRSRATAVRKASRPQAAITTSYPSYAAQPSGRVPAPGAGSTATSAELPCAVYRAVLVRTAFTSHAVAGPSASAALTPTAAQP